MTIYVVTYACITFRNDTQANIIKRVCGIHSNDMAVNNSLGDMCHP